MEPPHLILLQFFEMETYVFTFTNETAIRETELRKNPLYESYYTFWSKMVVMEIIPYSTIIVLNAFIVWKIVKSSRCISYDVFRTSMEIHKEQHEHQLSIN